MNKGIFLLLGTNLGDKMENLSRACEQLERMAGKIIKTSLVYKTAAWGKSDQPGFYNQVIELDTTFSPEDLLHKILSIENDMGRKREERWGARIIDIDILFYGDKIVNQKDLTIPHSGIAKRKFALVPLNEIASSFQHPVSLKKIKTLLDECSDPLPVEKLIL